LRGAGTLRVWTAPGVARSLSRGAPRRDRGAHHAPAQPGGARVVAVVAALGTPDPPAPATASAPPGRQSSFAPQPSRPILRAALCAPDRAAVPPADRVRRCPPTAHLS